MSRVLRVTVAALALVAVWVGLAMPPLPLAPVGNGTDGSTPGVVHIHTSRSDGRSTPAEIAAIAARAGLKFIVLTDHGDATRPPDPPAYQAGVLVIDAVEISTAAGHLVALNLPQAPYPLAGDAADVIADVHRLGGFAVAAHADSPKQQLRWTDWTAPLDGVELVNLDTAWRRRAAGDWRDKLRLLTAAVTYPIRPAPAIATLNRDSPGLLARWSELTRQRHLAVFGGADAHARLDLWPGDSGDSPLSLALPSYEATFRTMSTRVMTAEPLNGDATHDAAQVLAALTAGHSYLAFDALLTPPSFTFTASSASGDAGQGETLLTDAPVTLSVTANAPLPFRAVLFRDNEPFQEASSAVSPTWQVPPDPAVYRVEIRATDRTPDSLWVMSNPIYVNMPTLTSPEAPQGGVPSPSSERRPLLDDSASGDWTTESAPDSKAAVSLVDLPGGRRELLFRYGLPGGPVFGQYAAAVATTSGGIHRFGTLTFTARSERPLRLSVQLRQEGQQGEGWRWQRTVYVDSGQTTHSLALNAFRPMGTTPTPAAPLEHVSSILFAVDQTNTAPGSSGRVWFTDVALE